jgi:hypothetical protein
VIPGTSEIDRVEQGAILMVDKTDLDWGAIVKTGSGHVGSAGRDRA